MKYAKKLLRRTPPARSHLDIDPSILPYKPDYPGQLSDYLHQIREAIRLNKHHDHRRNLFLNYLRQAYGVEAHEVEIEQKVKVANVQGFIDALFKYLIFEFKIDLERERPAALLELSKYLQAQKEPAEYLALVTDGLKFELFQIDGDSLSAISTFSLDESDPLASYRALDNLVFASKKVTPRSIDITTRFGSYSAIFRKSHSLLKRLLNRVRNHGTVKVKIGEWNSLLARVYGEPLGDEDLFLKHTYLAVFSRLLVMNALFGNRRRTKAVYKGILDGTFFAKNNLPNLAEPDFFSWALKTEIEDDFIGYLASIDAYFTPYKLDTIGEDLLKEIYQELVSCVTNVLTYN
ncbi:MAG: hypothetical protein AB1644_04715 [Candidatus Zixiibacteriota bacterium]